MKKQTGQRQRKEKGWPCVDLQSPRLYVVGASCTSLARAVKNCAPFRPVSPDIHSAPFPPAFPRRKHSVGLRQRPRVWDRSRPFRCASSPSATTSLGCVGVGPCHKNPPLSGGFRGVSPLTGIPKGLAPLGPRGSGPRWEAPPLGSAPAGKRPRREAAPRWEAALTGVNPRGSGPAGRRPPVGTALTGVNPRGSGPAGHCRAR